MDSERSTLDTNGDRDIDSLSQESRNPDTPILDLGFRSQADTGSAPGDTRMVAEERRLLDSDPLSSGTTVLNISFETEIVDLRSRTSALIEEGDCVRFQPSASSSSTAPHHLSFEVPAEDRAAELTEATAYTFEAIAWYREWRDGMQGRTTDTLDNGDRLLQRLFREPVIYDPILSGFRPPTLPELLRPDSGKRLILQVARGLEDLGDVAGDLLRAFRAFATFICDNGACLPSEVNLRTRYGALVCPLGEGDIRRREPKSTVHLPRIETMPLLFEAIYDWACCATRWRWTAWRTAAATTLCFESGLRGIEACGLRFEDQPFGCVFGPEDLLNPLSVASAKGGEPREVLVNPWGWELLRNWLSEWRPEHAPTNEGNFFSSTTSAGRLASSSLAETSKRLLDHLKEKGMLHKSFTFHATRKTYATHFIERNGTNVNLLLQQCGWTSATQLGTYICPSDEAIRAQTKQLARSQGKRRPA